MKVSYDKGLDILTVVFNSSKVEESDEKTPGVIIDYDKQGKIVAMEILDASKQVDNPAAVEIALPA